MVYQALGALKFCLPDPLRPRLLALVDEPGLLSDDDPVQVVAYRRTTRDEYRDELQAVLLALPDGRILVSSVPMQ